LGTLIYTCWLLMRVYDGYNNSSEPVSPNPPIVITMVTQ